MGGTEPIIRATSREGGANTMKKKRLTSKNRLKTQSYFFCLRLCILVCCVNIEDHLDHQNFQDTDLQNINQCFGETERDEAKMQTFVSSKAQMLLKRSNVKKDVEENKQINTIQK